MTTSYMFEDLISLITTVRSFVGRESSQWSRSTGRSVFVPFQREPISGERVDSCQAESQRTPLFSPFFSRLNLIAKT